MTDFDPTEYNTTIQCTFDAPREWVWAAWTDPEQVAQWWGPEGFTVPRCELDVRPDGAFRIDMKAPDGTVYPSEGVFDDVVEPERLVLTGVAARDDDGNPHLEVRHTVTFTANGDTTELTLDAEVITGTPEALEHLEGMEEGWSQSLEKLSRYVGTQPGTNGIDVETTDTSLTVQRTFDAPRERVFRAFTDPDELAQWFVPEGMTAEVHALEPEPGGAFVVSWTDGENRIDNEGTYVEVVENERLVAVEQIPAGELRIAYEFRDVDDGTEVIVTQDFPGPVPDGAAEGWASILDNLEDVLQEQ